MKGILKADVNKSAFLKSEDTPTIKSNRLKACYARINIR